jgi:hypothetical protein
LFVNGALDGSANVSGSIQTTTDSFLIGGYGTGPWTLNGRVDEVSLYNRALNQSEIQNIFNAGTAGKFPSTPPSITAQPTSQTVSPGANATFTVTATSAIPLSYQWTFNGGAISGATASSYTVVNAQSPSVGSYAVVVANAGGSVLSSSANLSLLGPCTVPPSGLVSWWQAEGNTIDVVSFNMGPSVGVTYRQRLDKVSRATARRNMSRSRAVRR